MDPRPHAAVSRSGPQVAVADPTRRPPAEEWRKWPSVRAFIPNLPRGTTTYDIHKNLQRFGKVEFIRIEETRQGVFARTAHVTFKAPWDPIYRNGIEFRIRDGGREVRHQVKVNYAYTQMSARPIESPIRKGIKYHPEMTLHAEAIDFGYLERPTSMVIKATRGDPPIKLLLNLNRLEIEVHFPIVMQSKGKSTTRAYRFFVALDDQISLCEVQQHGVTSLVFHLNNPPWYSRQLKEAMQMSHAPDAFRWSADDTWSRQTDIVDDKDTYAKIDNTPVSVRKLYNSIDIARWTTFRVTVRPRSPVNDSLRQFLRALEDFNVPVTQNCSFKITPSPGKEAPVWNLLDGPQHPHSLTEQLSAVYLPFELRYQLEVCISQGWLNEYTINEAFLQRLISLPTQRAKQMLVHVDSYQKRVYDPMEIFTDLKYSRPVKARALPSNCVELYHATVTATGILFHTPSVEVTNRIVRKYQRYSDRFLRVRFEDDACRGKTRLYSATNGRMKLIFDRVRRTMRKGIVLGDRRYEFLAWGNSQLREHGAYFFASIRNPHIDADSIRESMGNFDREKVVAKRAARMGQCFSTTKPVSWVSRRSWKKDPIPDIIEGQYNFSDGIGIISGLAANIVSTSLGRKGRTPSAFQFRLGGCKGVLAVDPNRKGNDIRMRPSQYKFDCESDELEIIRVSEFWQPFLNRQLILVLSDLGVPDKVFLRKQQECIRALDRAMVDDAAALRSLRENVDPNLMTLNIATMIENGFRQTNEPFVTSLLRLYRAWTLKYLKEKAKIPVAQGAFVLGIVDETNTLKGYTKPKANDDPTKPPQEPPLPQIFIQYTDQHTGQPRIVEGICAIARNPSLHRGDVRVVVAVDVPELHHCCDVLVMPANGDRDLASMCSGGDLDGDDYMVIWDPDLIPTEWHAEPFLYEPPDPVTKEEISTDDIIDFFCDYLQNDYLGRIAHAHLAAADYLDEGIRSSQCLELVKLHSMAVDYPKTGVPAKMERHLERNNWPHFMEKKRNGVYRSRKILGQLYDAVEKVNFQPNWSGAFDRRILTHKPPPEPVLEQVIKLKKSYDEAMRRIMAQHQIRTEFEVWSTFVLHHSKAARDFKFHEEIGQHAKTLKEQYYEAISQEAGGNEFEKLAPFALAAYHITYNEVRQVQEEAYNPPNSEDVEGPTDNTVEMPFISFPWVLEDVLGKIANHTILEYEVAVSEPMEKAETTGNESDRIKTLLQALDNTEGSGNLMDSNDRPSPPSVQAGSSPDRGVIGENEVSVFQPLIEDPTRSKQHNLSDLAPLKTVTNTGARIFDDYSASDNSPLVSTVNSTLGATESSSTSPDEANAPQSCLSQSKGVSGVSLANDTSSHKDAMPFTPADSPTPAFLEHYLKDPAMMSKEEAIAAGVLGDSDDDDYGY
ncbi:uncharacterized protein Z518_04455 [Rhinocladiella mackenziei CBS 650.93]|uniref:RNA-dependent RNA polymerase n=1 Tax=Rhinocladiella mackenziei CBS 650.93 TaxID=1442369 RepID=A0A0D2ILA4_9EURO|nr:uncharacterized protein Z518_04455 [Rhinocladiella mackenziei CBS 650.93]KIX06479.1 hypothetical protein Z518_04455 [Rhinocladiella mackenziei CBS 650.93]